MCIRDSYEPEGYPFFWGVSPVKWEQAVAEGGLWHHALLLIDAVAGTPETQPGDLEVTAKSESGVIMGVRHKELTVEGVQLSLIHI